MEISVKLFKILWAASFFSTFPFLLFAPLIFTEHA